MFETIQVGGYFNVTSSFLFFVLKDLYFRLHYSKLQYASFTFYYPSIYYILIHTLIVTSSETRCDQILASIHHHHRTNFQRSSKKSQVELTNVIIIGFTSIKLNNSGRIRICIIDQSQRASLHFTFSSSSFPNWSNKQKLFSINI